MDEAVAMRLEEFSDLESNADSERDEFEEPASSACVESIDMSSDDVASITSESSVDSSFSGHYENTSTTDTVHGISGRWLSPKKLEGLAILRSNGSDTAVSDFVELAPFLTSCSKEFTTDGNRRFFAEDEYFRLDENTLCEVFALSVCLILAEGRGGDLETPPLDFFKKQWARSIGDLNVNLRAKTFSQLTFEAKHDVKWIDHN